MGRTGLLNLTNDRMRFLFTTIIIISTILLFISFHSLQSSKTAVLSTSVQNHHTNIRHGAGRLRKANYSRSVGFLEFAKKKRLQRIANQKSNQEKSQIAIKNMTFSLHSNSKSLSVTRPVTKNNPVGVNFLGTNNKLNLNSNYIKDNYNEQICKMPELKPFDMEIKHLIYDPEPINCKGQTNSYVKSNQIFIRHDVVVKAKYKMCQISTIERDSDLVSFITDPIDVPVGRIEPGKDVRLNYKVDSDFLIVGCENPDEITKQEGPSSTEYEMDIQSTHVDIHAHVYPAKKVIKHAHSTPQRKPSLGLNVIMFGVDSTSRLNFIRKMPKTFHYLTGILGSVVLEGYNIVGDATNGALTPILTGKHEKELPEVRKSFSNSTNVDVYPFIWKEFKKAGYATLFGEDSPKIAAYNWRLNGFNAQPTDHYMRTFWQEVSVEGLCLGPKAVHEIMLDYMQDFMFDYRSVPHFGFMLYTGLTHADINKLSLMDDTMYSFLKKVHMDGLLNNTLLAIYSDHGARYTKIRATLQGKLEERLPFMSIFVPKWIRRQYPIIFKNLQMNSDKLTTPFDIHATLRSILNYSVVGDEAQRGLSLFHEVPLKRSCNDAGVAPHWCACLKWETVAAENDDEINTIAHVILEELNRLVAPYSEHCARIVLKEVKYVQRMTPNSEILMFEKTIDEDQREPGFLKEANVDVHEMSLLYQVTVETAPGPGLFEATLKMSHDEKNITHYKLTEEISRINRYGDQPKCIADKYPKLAKYCFCKNQLNSGRDF